MHCFGRLSGDIIMADKGGISMREKREAQHRAIFFRRNRNSIITAVLAITLIFGFTGCFKKSVPVSTSFSVKDQVTQESTKNLELNLVVPVLSGFDAAGKINEQISESVGSAKTEVKDAASFMEKDQSQMKAGLEVSYLYWKSGNLVSLWIMMGNYTGGAHGLYWVEPYTFNTSANEIYRFSDLFREGDASADLVTEKILKKISENPELYFESAAETVKNYKNNYDYYINGDKLVVFFPLYDIAPYAGGLQFFDFSAEELKNLLKPEIYEAMKAGTPVDTKGTFLEH